MYFPTAKTNFIILSNLDLVSNMWGATLFRDAHAGLQIPPRVIVQVRVARADPRAREGTPAAAVATALTPQPPHLA